MTERVAFISGGMGGIGTATFDAIILNAINPTSFDAEELGATALTAFFNITAGWGLSAEEERTLLGSPPRSTCGSARPSRRWR